MLLAKNVIIIIKKCPGTILQLEKMWFEHYLSILTQKLGAKAFFCPPVAAILSSQQHKNGS